MLNSKLLENRHCFLTQAGIFCKYSESLSMMLACNLFSETSVINILHCISLAIFGRQLKIGYRMNYKLHIHMDLCVCACISAFVCVFVCVCMLVRVSTSICECVFRKRFYIKGNCAQLSLFLGTWSLVVGIFLRVVRRLILWVVCHTEFGN